MIPVVSVVANVRSGRRHIGLSTRHGGGRPLCNLSADPWTHYAAEHYGPSDINCQRCQRLIRKDTR